MKFLRWALPVVLFCFFAICFFWRQRQIGDLEQQNANLRAQQKNALADRNQRNAIKKSKAFPGELPQLSPRNLHFVAAWLAEAESEKIRKSREGLLLSELGKKSQREVLDMIYVAEAENSKNGMERLWDLLVEALAQQDPKAVPDFSPGNLEVLLEWRYGFDWPKENVIQQIEHADIREKELLALLKQKTPEEIQEIIVALGKSENADRQNERFLKTLLVAALVRKDPGFAITRNFNYAIDNPWDIELALQDWAKKEPGKASEWMNSRIQAGDFKKENYPDIFTQRQFEGPVIAGLLESNPAEAEKRLAALPTAFDRLDLLMCRIPKGTLSKEAQKAYLELVRRFLPDRQENVLSGAASGIASNGGELEAVTDFLNLIQLSPEKRKESAAEAAAWRLGGISSKRVITSEDVKEMRKWIENEAPEKVDEATGQGIAHATITQEESPGTYLRGPVLHVKEAGELALEFNKNSKDDTVLASFLRVIVANADPERVFPLAEQIRDPKVREEILSSMGKSFVLKIQIGYFDYQKAGEMALKYSQSCNNDGVLVGFLNQCAINDKLDQVMPWLEKVRDPNVRQEILETSRRFKR